jgi:dolichol-phosphate mannosyltransferase
VGFRQIGIPYVAAARAAGTTKYNYRRLASLALDAITSFSTVPLRLCGWIGLFAAVGVLPYALWAIYVRLFSDQYVPGWSAIIVSILFLGGVQLISLAVLGEYVGRVYDEVKGRPHYIVREYVGDDSCSVGRSGAIPWGANSKGTATPGESLERTHS